MSKAGGLSRQESAAKARGHQVDAQIESERVEDERLKFEQQMKKRDVRILRRGTMRGFFLMLALAFSMPLWLWVLHGREFEDRVSEAYAKYREPEPPDGSVSWHNLMLTPGYHIGGCTFLSVILCVLAWQHSSIPPLEEE